MMNLLLASLFFAVSGFGVIRTLDSDPAPEVETYPAQGASAARGHGRVFVLLIESLRARTALSTDLMPHLAALGSRGFTAVLRPVDETQSAGSLTAAFTGRDEIQGLGTLRMFVEPPRYRASLFTQLKSQGMTSVLYSDQWSFAPFHRDIFLRLPRREGLHVEALGPIWGLEQAKARFTSGSDQLVVYHLSILDSAAHRYGITHREYARIAKLIDDGIHDLDLSIGPQDHLVIMGDHGHTEAGRHGGGLDVPTLFVGRGPAFPRDRPFGHLPIRAVRALLSPALGLPLPLSYDGPVPLDPALISSGGLAQTALFRDELEVVDRQRFWQNFAIAFGLGGLFSVFFALRMTRFRSRDDFLRSLRRSWVLALLPVTLTILGFGLGLWMARDSGFRQILPDYVLNQVWGGLLILGLLGIWFEKWSAATFGLGVFGVLFLTLYPGVLSIGSPGIFAPSWILFIILTAFQILRQASNPAKIRRFRRQTVLWAIAVILMLQPFFHVESRDSIAGQLGPLIYEMVPTSLYPRSILSGILMWILTYRARGGILNKLLPGLMTLHIMMVQIRVIPEGHWGNLVLGLILLGLAYSSWRGPRLGRMELESKGFGRSAFLCALLVLTFYLIRVGHEARTNLLLVFVATRVSMLLCIRAARSVRDLKGGAMLLLFLGTLGVGWMTLEWGLTRVEWSFLYDFVSADLVYLRIGHFYPLILIRYVIPVMVIRLLVSEGLMGKTLLPRKLLAFSLGLKYTTSVAILLGAAVTTSASPVYVGILSHIAVFLLLALGLL